MIRGLFAQVYLHGLLMLIVVVVSALLVSFLTRDEDREHEVARAARYTSEQLAERWEDDGRLLGELERLHHFFGLSASAFSLDGRTRASVGEARFEPLSESEFSKIRDGQVLWVRPRSFAVPIYREEKLIGYVVGRGPRHRRPWRAAIVIWTVAVALALASVPLVKRIVRPLRRIGETTRAIGEGNLGARTDLNRRDEIGRLAGEVDEMAESLERSARIERELLANVSHELRTPMSRLRVALELAGEVEDSRRSRVLKDALLDIEEIDALTEDILMSARLDQGVQLETESTNIQAWVQTVVDRARRNWPERTIEFTGVGGDHRFDSKWLGRALSNVLENALKYSKEPVTVSLSDGANVRISVTDRGIGIRQDEIERIFTPFYRVGEGDAGRRGGFGLGLTLARRVVQAHGGSLEVESAHGEGSTFTVVLPSRL
ncbi:MAG: HAMP domain-containing sensor histidine kinase [Myxococcota bacterium]